MATIRSVENKFRVQIRKRSYNLSATFSDKETAEIWAKYQEDLIDNMHNFKATPESLITLGQCCDLKIKSLEGKQLHHRTMIDFDLCKNDFKSILDCPLSQINPEIIKEISNKMLSSTVRHGGSAKNEGSGSIRICSPSTVLRKLRVLSSVISYMIEKGANITNPAQVVVNQLKMTIIKNGGSLEDE